MSMQDVVELVPGQWHHPHPALVSGTRLRHGVSPATGIEQGLKTALSWLAIDHEHARKGRAKGQEEVGDGFKV